MSCGWQLGRHKKFFLSWKPIEWTLAESSFSTGSLSVATGQCRQCIKLTPAVTIQQQQHQSHNINITTLGSVQIPGFAGPELRTVKCIVSNIWFWFKVNQQFSQTPNFVGGKLWRQAVNNYDLRAAFNLCWSITIKQITPHTTLQDKTLTPSMRKSGRMRIYRTLNIILSCAWWW